jgi:ABC-2 type transport system permease protein
MTTASGTTTAIDAAAAAELRRPGFNRLLRSEWTKIRSVPSTVWSLIALIVLTLGFTTLISFVIVVQWDQNPPEQRALIVADPAGFVLGSGFGLSQLAICILGVMVVASEYSTGMIRASLLAVPRRSSMLAAKAVVFGLLVLAIGLAVSFASFFIGSSVLHDKAPVALGDQGVLRAVIGAGLYLATLGLFALALGAIIRHTAAAITAVIGFVLVLAPLTQLLPGDLGRYVHAYLPSEAGHLIAQAHQAQNDVLTPWQGYGVFVAWVVLLLAVAAILLNRRDA